jgi:HD-GYP domain-containing protein (c-di-GMP phosphodiesterase class II)
MGRQPFTVGWWAVHALDVTGVFGVLGGLWLAPQLRDSVTSVLEPVLMRDPLVALEIGLAPVVHRFVADLERKDQITRDHVVRVGEMAGRTAEAMHLPAARIRNTILGGLLHDVGKLNIDNAVLTKSSRLTDDEYRSIQRHTVFGDELLRAVASLTAVAPIVRAHHERHDGGGYPDRLVGDAIPLEARIVAACDAYDAMTHTRHYREGMGHDGAVEILHEHAGSQWDPAVVHAVARVAARGVNGVFDVVGRDATAPAPAACGCLDALPNPVRAALI